MHGRVSLALLGALGLAAEAFALHSSLLAQFLLLALLALSLVIVAMRVDLDRIGLLATYGAALLIPLYGVGGHNRPGDLLLPIAILLFAVSQGHRQWPALPRWVWLLTGTIVLIAVLHQLAPTNPSYLAARVVVDADGRPGFEPQTNFGGATRFLVSVLGVPLAFALATQRSAMAPRRIAELFAIGASFSGLVAWANVLGLGRIAVALGATAEGVRQGGLSGHPDFLAANCVLAAPIALWLAWTGENRRRFWIVLLPGVVAGVYESGSRGGAVSILIAVATFLVLEPRARRILPVIGAGLALVALYCFVLHPSIGHAILDATRLSTPPSGERGSDIVRQLVGAQGLKDLAYSPIDGVGLQVAAEAHNVYLQALAAGGVILFAAFAIFTLAVLAKSVALTRIDALAVPVAASSIAAAVFNGLENTLTYRFVYVPVGLVVALVVRHSGASEPTTATADDAPTIGAIEPVASG